MRMRRVLKRQRTILGPLQRKLSAIGQAVSDALGTTLAKARQIWEQTASRKAKNSKAKIHDGTVTALVFKTILQRLMVGVTNPGFVVVDGHPVHKSALVRQYVESQGGKLQLFFLPPYSPQLNPDEQVWAHVKRRVSSQLVESKDEMKRLALGALRRIQKQPNLVRSFFGHNECLYARM